MLAEGKRGPIPIGLNSQSGIALDQYAGALVSENLPRYMQQTYSGNMYHFSSGSITAGTTTNSPLAAGTAAPPIALWNPPGSGKNLIIAKVGAMQISGTPAGPLVWNYGNFTTLTTATQGTPVSGIMGQAAAAVAKVFSGQVTTGSVVGIFYKHAAAASATLITTTTSSQSGVMLPMYEDVGGDIVIPPGVWGAIASFGTGTSHVFQVGLSWIEAPI
jgi:hypothetical protein